MGRDLRIHQHVASGVQRVNANSNLTPVLSLGPFCKNSEYTKDNCHLTRAYAPLKVVQDRLQHRLTVAACRLPNQFLALGKLCEAGLQRVNGMSLMVFNELMLIWIWHWC